MLGWLLNLGFAGGGEAAEEPAAAPARSPGGRYVYLPDYPTRKFTKKDEEELKKLLLKVVEEETGHADLQKKAVELQEVSNAAAGIRRAVDKAQQVVRRQAMQNRINWIEAQRRIEELEEEEDLILLLAMI